MRDIARTKENYIFAGLATLSRQISFQLDDWFEDTIKYPQFKQSLAEIIFETIYRESDLEETLHTAGMEGMLHSAKYAEMLTSTAMTYCVTLVEQEAYPILLQISGEDAELMGPTLEHEKDKLAIMELLMPALMILNPLAWMSYGNFIESFKAQMECHQQVLDNFNESWEWITTKVKEVLDGDTITVYGVTESIRFSGIDCPEIWHEGDPGSPSDERYEAGWAAKEYTTARLYGVFAATRPTITIKLYAKRDIYERRIGKIYLEGKSFETELVREGHAEFRYYG